MLSTIVHHTCVVARRGTRVILPQLALLLEELLVNRAVIPSNLMVIVLLLGPPRQIVQIVFEAAHLFLI